jgi:hypothetical protein
MAFFKQSHRASFLSLSLSLGLAMSAGCGGSTAGQDPPVLDAATDTSDQVDVASTGGAGGAAGSAAAGGSGGASGSGAGAGGAAGSVVDSGRPDGNTVDGAAGAPGDAPLDTARTDAADSGACTDDTTCSTGHCVGGVCCAVTCTTPGTCEKLDGVTCPGGTACKYLKAADDSVCDDGNACTINVCFNGACVVKSNKDCNDNDQCTTDTCTASTGDCVHALINVPVVCDDGNPCTNDTCSSATGCQHSDNNAATCSDGNACTDDVCSGGVCVSTPKNCTSLSNDCNVGVCVNGACQAQPSNGNGVCHNGLVSCDATGKCDTAGHCVGNHDACGALSTACTACTNETGCYNGRLCTCQAGGVVLNGKCTQSTDECNANPCVALATCLDPTPDGTTTGDVTCTCPSGYTGNGKTAGTGCTDIDECNGQNPCGAGSAPGGCNGTSPPGSYSCTCATGYRSIPTSTGPTCACDLSGTYALSVKTSVGWDAVSVLGFKAIEESPAGGVETYRWALR